MIDGIALRNSPGMTGGIALNIYFTPFKEKDYEGK
jgi:hypothetical protein